MLETTSRTSTELRSTASELHSVIESSLQGLLREGEVSPAVRYAMFSGGKRIRPMLTLLAVQACGGDVREGLPAACAIECLHCASLIWDDMPCMDNAPERRGVSAVHVVFGEALATLAALSLLNCAYAIFGRYSGLAAEAGLCVAAMIEGQAADLEGGPGRDHRQASGQTYGKTTGLMRLTLTAGAIACGTSKTDVCVLARCGGYIGEAYQIFDDFEDGDAASQTGAHDMIAQAKSVLQHHFGTRAAPLIAAVDQIAVRCAEKKPVAA